MKTQNNKQEQTPLQTIITSGDDTMKTFIETKVPGIASVQAHSALPPEHGELSHFTGEITSFFQGINSDMKLKLSDYAQKLGNISDEMLEQQKTIINDKIIALRKLINNKKDEISRISINKDAESYKWYILLFRLVEIGEAIFLTFIFASFFQDGNLIVFLGSFIFAISFLETTKMLTIHFRDSTYIALWKKIAVIPLAIAVILTLELLRYQQVVINTGNEINTTTYVYINNPLIFVVLAMLPIIFTALLVNKYFLSDTELGLLNKKKSLQKEVTQYEQEIRKYNLEIESLIQKNNEMHLVNKYENESKNRIEGFYMQAVSLFKSENLKHRTDGVFPKSFSEQIPKLLLSLLLAIGLTSCTKTSPIDTTVLVDTTDSSTKKITAPEIISASGLENDIWCGITIQIKTINEYQYTDVYKYSLPSESRIVGNSKMRKRVIMKFTVIIDSVLHKLYNEQSNKKRSLIYTSIINSANELNKCGGKQKLLIIQSDLLEHSKNFNSYNSRDLERLKDNPIPLDKNISLDNDLKNLRVIICYRPRSIPDNDRHIVMLDYYTKLFKSHNIQVDNGISNIH